MPTFTAPTGQISAPRFVHAGTLISVQPGAGATVTLEYTFSDMAGIINRAAVWQVWQKGVATAPMQDITSQGLYWRVTSIGGAPSTVITEPNPNPSMLQNYRSAFGGTTQGAQAIITGSQVVGAVATAVPANGYSFTAGQWYRNGTALSGETGLTHTRVDADVGAFLTFIPSLPIYTAAASGTVAAVSTVVIPPVDPTAPTILSVTAAGASAQDIVLAAPTNPTGTVTGYAVRSIDVSTGQIVTSAYDYNGIGTATTRRIKGLPTGTQYAHQVAAVVGGVTGSYSALSSAAALPSINTAKTLTDVLRMYYSPALTSSDNITTSNTLHKQFTCLARDTNIASVVVTFQNASKTQATNLKVCFSWAPVAGAAVALGSSIGAGNIVTLNNSGTWTAPVDIVIPVSTATRGDAAPGEFDVEITRAMLPPLPRTDYVGTEPVLCVRAYAATGTSLTFESIVPGNGATGAAIDCELSKENPSVSVLKGRLWRSYRVTGVDGVTNLNNMTANNATFRPDIGLACYVTVKLISGTGTQVAENGDSRNSFAKSAVKACAGPLFLCASQLSTLDAPVAAADMGADGFGAGPILERAQQQIPKYTTSKPLVFLLSNTINGFGAGPSIQNYASNVTAMNQVRDLWVAQNARIVRTTTLGVDPASPSYQWTGVDATGGNTLTDDVRVRHGGNETLENASTAAAPVIPIGSLSEGAVAGNGTYSQISRTTGENWIEQGSGDPTKAHYTYNWAVFVVPFYLPFFKA